MNIIFLILKILGIILLVLLGILVILLNTVLLMPAKYQIKAKADGDVKSTTATIKAFWLFRLLSVSATYINGEFQWKARVFWNTFPKKEEKQIEKPEKQEKDQESFEEGETEGEIKERTPKVTKTKKAKGSKRKSWLQKIKCTIKDLYGKIKWIWKNKDDFLEFVNDEGHRKTFEKVKNDILIIIKHFRPRKCKGYLEYGFDDPYQTGRVLAGLSILYPFYGKEFDVRPNFEEQILKGDLIIKGHMRAIHFLRIFKYFVFDKTVKDLIKYVKNIQTQI